MEIHFNKTNSFRAISFIISTEARANTTIDACSSHAKNRPCLTSHCYISSSFDLRMPIHPAKISLEEKDSRKLRLEYAVYYLKANGSSSRKIFKFSESTYDPGKPIQALRQHSFKELTTRKHYAGKHMLAVIVNGN